jgi:Lysyl oxidase
MTRRFLHGRRTLLVPLALVPVLLWVAATRVEAVSDKLPDLEQQVPKQVQIGGGSGNWQIGFLSEVVNRGSGNLEIHGHRATTSGNMTADQIVYKTDGTTRTIGGVGDLHYETGFGHKHWHFEPFDHYEIRTVAGALIGTDEKEGFCLGDNNNHGGGSAVYDDPSFCQQNNPSALELTEGISPGWGDSYDPLKEGQDVPISQSAEPTGDYNLVHRVNENSNGSAGPVAEASFGNNVASAAIHISWSSGGTPSVSVKKTCMGTALCASPTTTTTTTTTSTSRPTTTTTTTLSTTTSSGTTTTQTLTPHVDDFPPTLAFTSSPTERFKSHSTAVWFYARCDEQCTLTAQGTISIGGSAAALRTGKVTITLTRNSRTKIVLSLSRKLRRIIRRAVVHHKRVRVKVTTTAVDTAGHSTASSRTLTLTR